MQSPFLRERRFLHLRASNLFPNVFCYILPRSLQFLIYKYRQRDMISPLVLQVISEKEASLIQKELVILASQEKLASKEHVLSCSVI